MNITPTNTFFPLIKASEKSKDPDKLKEAAEGFETLLTHQLVQELQKDLEGQSLFGDGVEGNTLGAMAEWGLATHLAKTLDLGVLKQLQATVAKEKGEQ